MPARWGLVLLALALVLGAATAGCPRVDEGEQGKEEAMGFFSDQLDELEEADAKAKASIVAKALELLPIQGDLAGDDLDGLRMVRDACHAGSIDVAGFKRCVPLGRALVAATEGNRRHWGALQEQIGFEVAARNADGAMDAAHKLVALAESGGSAKVLDALRTIEIAGLTARADLDAAARALLEYGKTVAAKHSHEDAMKRFDAHLSQR